MTQRTLVHVAGIILVLACLFTFIHGMRDTGMVLIPLAIGYIMGCADNDGREEPKSASMPDTAVISALFAIAKEQNVPVSAVSWGGFNLMGDRASINEVHRLMTCEARLQSLEREAQDAKAMRNV